MRLAAGLRPDPLWELKRSPSPLAAIGGKAPTSKGKGEKGRGKEREGEGTGEEKGRKGRERGGDCLLSIYLLATGLRFQRRAVWRLWHTRKPFSGASGPCSAPQPPCWWGGG